MNNRYEVRSETLFKEEWHSIFDNLKGDYIEFKDSETRNVVLNTKEYQYTLNVCCELNTDHNQHIISEQIMKVAGIGGVGVNLYNEFCFTDLWEVVEWFVSTFESSENEHYLILADGFDTWFSKVCLHRMKQHKMQAAITDKIYELMKDAGMIQ